MRFGIRLMGKKYLLINRNIAFLLLLLLLTMFVIMVAPFIGGRDISFNDITNIFYSTPETTGQMVFWHVRFPRVILSFLVGATLSICGMVFQSIFRNTLATPFTLGLSSGASFGAILAIKLHLDTHFLYISTIQIFSFSGGIISIAIVYLFLKVKKNFSSAVMLLVGIALNMFFNSLILFVQYMADNTEAITIMRWLLGNLNIVGFRPIIEVIPFCFLGLIIIFYKRSELNLLMTNDEIATGRGLNVERTRIVLFLAVSVSAGAVTSVCGPIGFLGLIIPNLMRIVFGSDHFDLAPACFLGGGIFLVICDSFARLLIYPAEIPVGVILALIGGPCFLWFLFRTENI